MIKIFNNKIKCKQSDATGQTICLYLNNTILCWPEDGRLTAETCRQI